jgi:hypothetical protein
MPQSKLNIVLDMRRVDFNNSELSRLRKEGRITSGVR